MHDATDAEYSQENSENVEYFGDIFRPADFIKHVIHKFIFYVPKNKIYTNLFQQTTLFDHQASEFFLEDRVIVTGIALTEETTVCLF